MFNFFQELGLPPMSVEIVADNARSHAPIPDDSSSIWSSHVELSHSSHSGRRDYCRWDSDGSSCSHQSPTTVAFHFRSRAARRQRQKSCEHTSVPKDQHQPPSRIRSFARQNRYPKKLHVGTHKDDDQDFDSDNDRDHDSAEEPKSNCRWFAGSPDPLEQSPDQMRRTRKHLKRRGLPPRLPTRPQLTRATSEPCRVTRVRTWPPLSSVISVPAVPSSLDDSYQLS